MWKHQNLQNREEAKISNHTRTGPERDATTGFGTERLHPGVASASALICFIIRTCKICQSSILNARVQLCRHFSIFRRGIVEAPESYNSAISADFWRLENRIRKLFSIYFRMYDVSIVNLAMIACSSQILNICQSKNDYNKY